MKIKSDFVTNSSSTAYIITDTHFKGRSKYITDKMNFSLTEFRRKHDWTVSGKISTFKNVDQLDYYTNGEREVDWAQKPRGPEFYYVPENEYLEMRGYIQDGKTVHYLIIDRNVDMSRHMIDQKFLRIESIHDH